MLNIKIICVGKLKEKHYLAAAAEYMKRLTALCRLEVEELPESRLPADPSPAEVEQAMKKEGESIALRIPSGALTVALCVEGKELDSLRFSEFLEACALRGKSRLCFVIGSSVGLSPEIKERAEVRMSMSKMTFPHHLARIMLLEQLYRAFQIREGTRYHK
ncbi:MAG: 23S rRNA (pseudouridine(1915)-N(3))-methyltransferase RlmH [Oscillospiraceae bacterium]|nr:23S rRNA (pseudouridine(1915)-N(3))-methyltransferase RlmH [Oscillospiraceae bacterium]